VPYLWLPGDGSATSDRASGPDGARERCPGHRIRRADGGRPTAEGCGPGRRRVAVPWPPNQARGRWQTHRSAAARR